MTKPPFSIALLVLSAAPAAGQATFTPVDTGPRENSIWAISPDGAFVAGWREVSGGGVEAIRWDESNGVTGLGWLSGTQSSRAEAVSSLGTVVVGTAGGAAFGPEAFRWTAATGMVGIGVLPGGHASQGLGVSADGDTVVGGSQNATGTVPFRWTPSAGMVPLPLPAGADHGGATATNADGSVVVGIHWNATGTEVFRWTPATGTADIGELAGGGRVGNAAAVSDDGSVIVGTGQSDLGLEAARWTSAGGWVGLGDFPGGAFWSSAYDVSADGEVVVGFGTGPATARGFVWTPELGLLDFQERLARGGVTEADAWTTFAVTGVSDDGRAFCGLGLDPAGELRGWRATLELPAPIGASYCGPANLNSTGAPATISALGITSVVWNDVRIDAAEMPPAQFGIFLTSPQQGFVANPGGSQGNLCLAGGIGRYSKSVLPTGTAGAFSLQLDLNRTPTPMGDVAIQPGESWNFQAWFRDLNPGPTSNFTDGLSIRFD